MKDCVTAKRTLTRKQILEKILTFEHTFQSKNFYNLYNIN